MKGPWVPHHPVYVAPQKESAPFTGWRLLKTRDFGALWAGQIVSQIGDGMNKVALLWFVYEITGSALKMSVIMLLQTIPPLVLAPVIGVYLDRLPKKPVMIGIDLIQTILIGSIPALYALDALTLERLYAFVFLISVFGAAFGPALASAIPLVVDRAHLVQANALTQSTMNIGVLIGPSIAGFSIALIGAQNVLYLDAGCNLTSALLLVFVGMRESLQTAEPGLRPRTVLQDLEAGIRFLFLRQKLIFNLMLTAALYTFSVSAFVLMLPVYAKTWLQVGPIELGWIWSSLGAGMLATSIWLGSVKTLDLPSRLKLLPHSMAVGALAIWGLGALKAPLLAAGLTVVIGASTALFMPLVWGILQELTPSHLRGRMFTLFNTGGMASAMVGMTGFGWAADVIGPAPCLAGIGISLFAASFSALRVNRRFLAPATAATV